MTAFPWTARLVAEALGLPPPERDRSYAGIATDTRASLAGTLFVALQGERFDAHDFLGDAQRAGVAGVVVRRGTPRLAGPDWFAVEDTLAAYGALARARRDRFAGPVVAITGSTGKTSTKELTAAALAPRYVVHKSERNLNNLVGVPLTVLAAPLEATAMVVECGASVPGELARQRAIVRPDVAVVTQAGVAHLEGFGSEDAVLVEKVSLLAGAPTAVVGTTPPRLPERARALAARVVTAALQGPADWTPERVTMLPDGRARCAVRGVEVELPVRGRHMVENALLALAVADALGVSPREAAPALAAATLPGGRSAVFEADGCTVIDDSYNSNPTSLRAALDLLTAIRGGRRAVVVVGTMRELGERTAALHEEAARAVLAARPDVIAAVGAFVPAFRAVGGAGRATLLTGETPEDLAPALAATVRAGDVVLLKASRGVALERLIPRLWPGHAPFTASEVH